MVMSLRSRLLRVAATLEGGDVEAEDFVQETFLRLWAMRQRLDSHPNIEALATKTRKNSPRSKAATPQKTIWS